MLNKIKKIIQFFFPPPNWRFVVIVFLGIILGLALTVYHISNASSYMSDDPKTCINCHVMTPQYITWQRSSHGRATTCNDCHVPQDNFFRKIFFKASDGMRHSYMFTFRLEPQVVQIKEAGISVVQENCIRCHEKILQSVEIIKVSGKNYHHGEGHLCWDCHREVPHGRVHSLSSTPYAQVPQLSPVLPEWIKKLENK